MRDQEGNKVTMVAKLNQHILVLGKSGAGKTYWLLKHLKKIIVEGKRVYILDFSGSYIKTLIEEDNPEIVKQMRFVSLKEDDGIVWRNPNLLEESVKNEIVDLLIKLLNIDSIYQTKLAERAVELLLETEKKFSFQKLYGILNMMLKNGDEEVETRNDFKNLEHLMSRLAPYRRLKGFVIKPEQVVSEDKILVFQLHALSEQRKRFFTSFLLELIVNEMDPSKGKRHCDALVLDEFQFLPFGEDDALTRLLRESRRFKFEVILLTQYISSYDSEKRNTLGQVDNLLLFKPTDEDLPFTAQLIDRRNVKEWENFLVNFPRGKAVLKGHYTLNANQRVCEKPLICTIEKAL